MLQPWDRRGTRASRCDTVSHVAATERAPQFSRANRRCVTPAAIDPQSLFLAINVCSQRLLVHGAEDAVDTPSARHRTASTGDGRQTGASARRRTRGSSVDSAVSAPTRRQRVHIVLLDGDLIGSDMLWHLALTASQPIASRGVCPRRVCVERVG